MQKILILGAGGFIGHHLTKRLKKDDCHVTGADLVHPRFSETQADIFLTGDLRSDSFCQDLFDFEYDRIYQLAADMGGAGYVFSGDHDATIMSNSVQINLNVLRYCRLSHQGRLFFSSSACIYPEPNTMTTDIYAEHTAYPAAPDSNYGWEKLFSERLYEAHAKNFGIDIRIARFHNIYGPEGAWTGGREKAIAAICRKVIEAKDGEHIEIWGDGLQSRSFLYIDECLEGVERLMRSSYDKPINIGSDEMVTIQSLAEIIIGISGKKLRINNIQGPTGVEVRTSNNALITKELGWSPTYPLIDGLKKTYAWIEQQMTRPEAAQKLVTSHAQQAKL